MNGSRRSLLMPERLKRSVLCLISPLQHLLAFKIIHRVGVRLSVLWIHRRRFPGIEGRHRLIHSLVILIVVAITIDILISGFLSNPKDILVLLLNFVIHLKVDSFLQLHCH